MIFKIATSFFEYFRDVKNSKSHRQVHEIDSRLKQQTFFKPAQRKNLLVGCLDRPGTKHCKAPSKLPPRYRRVYVIVCVPHRNIPRHTTHQNPTPVIYSAQMTTQSLAYSPTWTQSSNVAWGIQIGLVGIPGTTITPPGRVNECFAFSVAWT